MALSDNLHRLRSELGSIKLVAVTKGRSSADILELLNLGITDIGENRVQEAEEKFAQLIDEPLFQRCAKHMIGHVQSNKAKKVAELFDVVQSVDSLKIAQKLSTAAQSLNKTLRVFIEVNATGESQKYGILPADAPLLAAEIRNMKNLQLCGIMGMGPQGSEQEIRSCFRHLKALRQQLQVPELSMGMSADYRIALQEGSTMVRIGTRLFD